jgi:YD repeat-containing protein
VTEYEYSPVNLVSNINYNGTGELVEMEDWNGKTSIGRDLLNRVTEVTDHNGRKTAYGWDNVGNKTRSWR